MRGVGGQKSVGESRLAVITNGIGEQRRKINMYGREQEKEFRIVVKEGENSRREANREGEGGEVLYSDVGRRSREGGYGKTKGMRANWLVELKAGR